MDLQTVFLENRAGLSRFLRARGADHLIEDILQDMWLKLGEIDPQGIIAPLPYLFRMADNLLRDRFRVGSHRAARERAWGEMTTSQDNGAESDRLARESLEEAQDALQQLGERTYSILLRYRVDGVSQKEIARELGISLSLVEKHLQRAYRVLSALRRRWLTEDADLTRVQQEKMHVRD